MFVFHLGFYTHKIFTVFVEGSGFCFLCLFIIVIFYFGVSADPVRVPKKSFVGMNISPGS